jgi:DNA-binding CsgD family transcriptional regulator
MTADESDDPRLSEVEMRVLRLWAKGETSRVIGPQVGLSSRDLQALGRVLLSKLGTGPSS